MMKRPRAHAASWRLPAFFAPLVFLVALAVACNQPARPPAAEAPAAPAAPAANPGAAASADTAEWDAIVAAARREGQVTVMGPPGGQYRKVMEDFEARYPEIRLEFTGVVGRDGAPRILAERRGGQKLWDVCICGAATMYSGLKPEGALADVGLTMLLPELKRDDAWYGGIDFGWLDLEKRYVYAFGLNASKPLLINRAFLPASELNDPAQLTDPKFRGKILWEDPRGAGAGSIRLTSLMNAFGEDFVRKVLSEQDVVFSTERRQMSEWLVRGRYPILIGGTAGQLEEFQAEGLGREVEEVGTSATTSLTTGYGAFALLEGGPHPNAQKVFANWLLSRSAQDLWARLIGENSRRTDVAPGDPNIFPDPTALHTYFRTDEASEPTRLRATDIAKALVR